MEGDITKGPSVLVNEAPVTALDYYNRIARELDEKYGSGWSEKHSDTVARLSLVAAIDFHTAITNRSLQQLRDKQIFPLEPIQVDVLGGE